MESAVGRVGLVEPGAASFGLPSLLKQGVHEQCGVHTGLQVESLRLLHQDRVQGRVQDKHRRRVFLKVHLVLLGTGARLTWNGTEKERLQRSPTEDTNITKY